MGILKNYATYITDNGIKQTFLVDKTGILQPKISRLMNNTETSINVEDYVKLCKAVKRTPNYFLDVQDKIDLGIDLEPEEKAALEKEVLEKETFENQLV